MAIGREERVAGPGSGHDDARSVVSAADAGNTIVELAPGLVMPRVRCAPFHGSQAADPVGSAGVYDAFLFVEVPLPWEQDISRNEPFRSLMDRGASVRGADGTTWRPMGVVPPEHADGSVRVTAYRRADEPGGVGPYLRSEWRLEDGEVGSLCRALLDGHGEEAFASRRVDVADGTLDLFVCTHGRRDSCCGSLGPGVYQELAGMTAQRSGPPVRLARCSHTGGHRFAPTALTFPDGYAWAHLTADLADRLVRRDGPPSDFAAHCRGSSLFEGAPAQVADRAALVRVGWEWAGGVRRAEVVAFERDTLATTVQVSGRTPAGAHHAFEVRAEVERHIPAPTCGLVDVPEYRVEPVWRAAAVEPLEPAVGPSDAQ